MTIVAADLLVQKETVRHDSDALARVVLELAAAGRQGLQVARQAVRLRQNVLMDIPIKLLILAAGLGTRMKSKKAKVLHRAGGRALVEHVVDTALSLAPPERVFVVTGFQAELVQAALEGRGVRFVAQAEQKGTADAVMACREAAGGGEGLVVVLYGDCPLLSAGTLTQTDRSATPLQRLPPP